jgi:hypothetical protein
LYCIITVVVTVLLIALRLDRALLRWSAGTVFHTFGPFLHRWQSPLVVLASSDYRARRVHSDALVAHYKGVLPITGAAC